MKTDDTREDIAQTPPAGRTLRPSIAVVFQSATVVALALFAVFFLALPITAAVIGSVLLIFVAVVSRRIALRETELGPRIRRRVWPDAGVKAVVEAIDEPCVVVDRGGAVRWFNRPALARFPALVHGNPLSFALRVTPLLDAVDTVRVDRVSNVVEWHDKVPTERWSRAHVAPLVVAVGEGERRSAFVLVRIEDLTEARRTERMRADFVANASHELRTPLAALSGFVETLQGPARDDAVARQRFLAIMAEQAGRMRRLIDDLLSLSRIEMKAHLRPEAEVDICDVLAHVVDLAAPGARAQNIEFRVEGCDRRHTVRGDRDELVQVFTNLVENAVKYGGGGGLVEIAVRADAAHVTCAVRDHGDGIDPVHLPRLTERFYRAHADGNAARRGTGLGLAIVKHIVTRHGGRLDISSRRGEGSVFSVLLDRFRDEDHVEDQKVGASSN